MSSSRNNRVLLGIALFKLVKASLLVVLGIAAVSLGRQHETWSTLQVWVQEVGIDPNRPWVARAIAKIADLDQRRLQELSVGTFVYAAVFLVEGTGLLLHKTWAEYLTILVTASFIPFEIYEMVHKPSALKALGIVLNAAIVIYLIVRRWREHRNSERPSRRVIATAG